MERWIGKVAVVTGASAGIGLHTAQALVREGMVVVGLARRKNKMEEGMEHVKGPGKFHAVECDITNEESVIKAFEGIKNQFGTVHVMINNAGMMNKGPMTGMPSEQLESIININVLGLLRCTREAVNLMKAGKHEGHVVNVGSYLGHKVLYVEGLSLNVYPATKFAVRALSETLQNELRDEPIRVTHISPGIVKTEFFDVAGVGSDFLEAHDGLLSDDVADAIVSVIRARPHVLISELTIRHLNDLYR